MMDQRTGRRPCGVRRERLQVGRVVLVVAFHDEHAGKVDRNALFILHLAAAPRAVAGDQRQVRLAERRLIARTRVNVRPPAFGGRAARHVQLLVRFRFRVFVALGAVFVQDRLNESGVTDAFRAPRGRREIDRRFAQSGTHLAAAHLHVATRIHVGLVAAEAAAIFARHHVRERAHHVNRLAFFIQHFEENGLPRREFEVHRAIVLYRDRAEDALHAVRLEDGNRRPVVLDRFVPRRVSLRVHLDHADEFPVFPQDRVRAFEHVIRVQNALFGFLARADLRPVNQIGLFERDLTRTQRRGVVRVIVALIDQFFVPVNVLEVEVEEPPKIVTAVQTAAAHPRVPRAFIAAGRVTCGDQHVLLRERVRGFVGEVVARFVVVVTRRRVIRTSTVHRPARFGPVALARDQFQTVRVVQSFVRVDVADRSVKPRMVTDGREHDFLASGDLTRFGQHVRPRGLVPPESLRVRAVRIDRPERLHAPERFVRVFPAGENDAPVLHHTRQIFRLTVRGNDVNILPIRVTAGHGK